MKKRISQIFFFLFFTLFLNRLFFEHLPGYIIALSPIVHIGNLVALATGASRLLLVLPALLLMVIGLLYHRLFCFYACPLGFLQEILPSLKKNVAWLNRWGKLNYIVFALLCVSSLLFINLLGAFDPLVTFARLINAFTDPFPHHYGWFLLPFGGILLLSFYSRRLWCWYLCPLGAFFDGCRDVRTIGRPKEITPVDHTRRTVIVATGFGLLAGLGLKRLASAYADERLIRPPGALKENQFKKVCIRCGNCMKACITNGLQPTVLEGGWDGMFAPRLIPLIGECDEFCTRCGTACPTGAITALPLDEKRQLQLGIAEVDKSTCLGWNGNELCFICGEFCPYLAIERYMKGEKIPCPIIKADVCRGCGLCEKQCPTHAIKVFRKT